MLTNVHVVPIYGYGWHQGDGPIDVPPPFLVRVSRYEASAHENQLRKILGIIETDHSALNGRWICLFMRTLGPPAHYSLRIYDTPPLISEEFKLIEEAEGFISGFAMASIEVRAS